MASTISNGLQKVINMNGAASNNPKLAQLAEHTVNYDNAQNARITTDFGQKVSNTDHWLSASTEDHYGPALLEDTHGREKASIYLI
jgi:catalase